MDTAIVFMNRTLAESVGIEVPFEDVYSGTWTFDKFFSYGDIATRDLDGDGMDFEDMYTYSAHIKRCYCKRLRFVRTASRFGW